MTDEAESAEETQLKIVQWHIMRASGQRAGLWARTTAVLGAGTLVVAGAALMLAAGNATAAATRFAALASMASVLMSAVWATNVIAPIRNWSKTVEAESPPPLLFSLSDTVQHVGSYAGFQELVAAQTIDRQLQAATSELWRIGLLNQRRVRGLR
ncbi:hypothetical protein [Dactylosporangium salmoneum]|uniref:hypothetical protein n=1 Tax=Dactylosporangium salmoneum TaxID=53361 RepID=UPI0031D49899